VSNGYFNPAALSGSITLTYTAGVGTCASSAQQTFTVLASPLPPTVSGTLVYCEGQNPQTLTANGVSGATFNWFEDETLASLLSTSSTYIPITAANDTLYVTQSNGSCSSAATTVIIEVNSTPIAPLVQSPVNYCQGSLPILNAVSSSSLFWYSDALLSSQVATGSSYQPSNNTTTSYWVVAANGSCNSLPSQIDLIEQQVVNAAISVVGPSVLCGGNSITLASSYSSGNSWSTGETTDTIYVSSEGTYTLSVASACNTSTDDFIATDATVVAAFTANPLNGAEPLSVIVTDESQNADQCNWLINDVASSIVSGASLELMMGEYVITHICTNTAGCADTLSRTIQVISDKVDVQIPNSFTPNGDGMNEQFKVKSMGITQLKAVVFNRWGNKVAEFEGVTAGWDGTSDNGLSPDGVYFYIINTTDVLNQENTYKGSVTLLR
jgi:gliding motility-associated-like protein